MWILRLVFFGCIWHALCWSLWKSHPHLLDPPTHPSKVHFLCAPKVCGFSLFPQQLPYVSSNLVKSYSILSPSPVTIKTKDSQAVCGEEECWFWSQKLFPQLQLPISTSLNSWDDKRNTISFSSFWKITMHQHKK